MMRATDVDEDAVLSNGRYLTCKASQSEQLSRRKKGDFLSSRSERRREENHHSRSGNNESEDRNLQDIPYSELDALRQGPEDVLDIPATTGPSRRNLNNEEGDYAQHNQHYEQQQHQKQHQHQHYQYNANNGQGEMLVAEASAEAIKAHARDLGMELERDYEYLWIAEEALLTELEYPWVELYDQASSKTYYYNEQTCESRWENPVDAQFRNMLCQLKREKLVSQPIVASLSKREARLRRELERERAHYKEKKAEWNTREAKLLRQARKRESNLKRERDEWRTKLQTLDRDNGSDRHSSNDNDLVLSYERQVANLKVQVAEMCTDHSHVCHEYERQATKLQQQNASCLAEMAEMRQSHASLVQGFEHRGVATIDKLERAETAQVELGRKLAGMKERAAAVKKELERKVAGLEGELAEATLWRDKDYADRQTESKTRLAETEARLAESEAHRAELTEQQQGYERRIANLEGELAALTDGRTITANEYERQITALKNDLLELSARMSDGRAVTVQEYERHIADLDKSVASAEDTLAKAKAREQALLHDLEQVTSVTETNVEECSAAKALAGKLEQALAQARLENEIAHEKQDDLRAENTALLEKIASGEGNETVVDSGDGNTASTSSSEQQQALISKYRRRCKRLERVVNMLHKDLGEEQGHKQVMDEVLDESQKENTMLNVQILKLEADLEASKRDTYFSQIERQHVEEELVTRKLSCSCGFGRQTKGSGDMDLLDLGPILNPAKARVLSQKEKPNKQEDDLLGNSDTENNRATAHTRGRSTAHQQKVWRRANQRLEEENAKLKLKSKRTNQHACYILRSMANNK